MPTLYVENVPEELYEAIRTRAQGNRRSLTAEVLDLLAANVAAPAELTRGKAFLKRAARIRSERPASPEPFPSSEEIQREDRTR
jgi:plasmid stability protein